MLLGLNGAAGAGKDTFGFVLRDEFGYHKAAYADKLREALETLDPTIVANGEHHGPLPAGYRGPVYRGLAHAINEYGWEGYKTSPFSMDIRRLIQVMGTEVGRGIAGENVWINATFKGLNLDNNNVITDVRFPNEAEAIKEAGGYIIHIDRPDVENRAPAHASETSMNDWKFDFTVTNNARDILEYQNHVRAFMDYLGDAHANA